MHPADRVPHGLLGCVGAATVAAVLTLGAAAAPARPWLGMTVGAIACVLLATPIAAGVRRTRLRARLSPSMRADMRDTGVLSFGASSGAPDVMRADATALWVPSILLTTAARRRAEAAGDDGMRVPWCDIVRWEVMPAMGTPLGQHVLVVASDHRKDRIGVIRTPLVRQHEAALLAFARAYLRCDIEVRDADVA
jgi:hypothetical protein